MDANFIDDDKLMHSVHQFVSSLQDAGMPVKAHGFDPMSFLSILDLIFEIYVYLDKKNKS